MPVSAREPFATALDTMLMIGNVLAPLSTNICNAASAEQAAAAINAAHADRVAAELEAAASMIEPSEIKSGPGGPPGFVQGKEAGRMLAAQHLRDRAKTIREGGGK